MAEQTSGFPASAEGSDSSITTSTPQFMGHVITIQSANFHGPRIDVLPSLRHPEDFHGDPLVHDVVNFGGAMATLIGEYDDPNGFFADRDQLPDKGVIILADHVPEAAQIVSEIDDLAQQLVDNPDLYGNAVFCLDYFDLAKAGYAMLNAYLPSFPDGTRRGTPISLERAGLVTTRLAHGLGRDDVVPREVPVVTKRAHHVVGNETDLMVTVKWRNPEQLEDLDGRVIEIADFVNPASWASTAGLLMAARNRGVTPSTVLHRSIMGTEQGIEFAHKALLSSDMGYVEPAFFTLGVSRTLTPQYYLTNPGVGDAGHVLRHSLPSWYKP